MFSLERFNLYCRLLQELANADEDRKKEIIEDLEVIRSGLLPIKYMYRED